MDFAPYIFERDSLCNTRFCLEKAKNSASPISAVRLRRVTEHRILTFTEVRSIKARGVPK